MEINKQFLQISISSFVISIVAEILSIIIFIIRDAMFIDYNFQILMLLSLLNMWIGFTIAPVLIFVIFYLIGKKPNTAFKLKPIMSALLIGNIVSFFISSIIYSVVANETSVPFIASYFGQLIFTLLPTFVLSALAGLSIGHTRRKSLTLNAESQLV